MLLRLQYGGTYTFPEVNSIDVARGLSTGLQTLALMLCVPIVAIWTFKANVGARAIGAVGMAFSPFASVAWYFVPIAYLWVPYRAMSEIWRASHDVVEWQKKSTPLYVRVWWSAWVLYMLSTRVVSTLLRVPETISDYVWAAVVGLVGNVAAGVAALTLIWIIQAVSDRQEEEFRAAQIAHAREGGPGGYWRPKRAGVAFSQPAGWRNVKYGSDGD